MAAVDKIAVETNAGEVAVAVMAPLPARYVSTSSALHPDDQEIICLVERGLDPKMVAAKTGAALHQVRALLASDAGRRYMDELRAGREFGILEEVESFRKGRKDAATTLVAALTQADTWADRIRAANSILEKDPDGLFSAKKKVEVSGRVELGYDRDSFLNRTGDLLNEVCATPGDVLDASYGELPVAESEPDDPDQDDWPEPPPAPAQSAAPVAPSAFHYDRENPPVAPEKPAPGERVCARKETKAERSARNKAEWAAKQEAKKQARRMARAASGDTGAEGDG